MDIKKKDVSLRFCEVTIQLKLKIEEAFLELAARLFKIKQEQLFVGQYEDFGVFCQELKITESVASRLISIHEKLVLKYKISPAKIGESAGWNDAYLIATLAKTKEEAEGLLDESAVLTSTDFRESLAIKKLGHECEHPETYTIECCKVYGKKIKKFDDNNSKR